MATAKFHGDRDILPAARALQSPTRMAGASPDDAASIGIKLPPVGVAADDRFDRPSGARRTAHDRDGDDPRS